MIPSFVPERSVGQYFSDLKLILHPWLGECRVENLPANPDDIVVMLNDIMGHGFRRITWRNTDPDPSWIRPSWRTKTEVDCQGCQSEVQAFEHPRLTNRRRLTGGSFVFCQCLRMEPSRLPKIEFFTENWDTALATNNFLKQVARELRLRHERSFYHTLNTPT